MDKPYLVEGLFSVRGKKAIVTGGASGLGMSMAMGLMQNGCDVAVADRNPSNNEGQLKAYAEECGVSVLILTCDMQISAQCDAMVEEVKRSFGRIDILLTAAGTTGIKTIDQMDDETWNRVLDVNLTGVFRVIRAASHVMMEQKYGKIINISSIKSLLGTTRMGYGAYCASKGGINMLTKQCAGEFAKYGITVNAIAPTYIRTNMNAELLTDLAFKQSLEDRIPMGRIGELKDLMGLLLLFASEASQFITGQVVFLDGGLTAVQD